MIAQHDFLRRTLAAAAIAALLTAPHAMPALAQDGASLVPGTPYATVRKTLEAQGFEVLAFPRSAQDSTCGDICDAYPEILDCSGMGINPCRFAFRDPRGGYLVGVASGETPDQLTLDAIGVANAEDSKSIERYLADRPEVSEVRPPESNPPNKEPAAASAPTLQEPDDGADTTQLLLIGGLILAGLIVYLLPSIIAFRRHHHYRWPILAFNVVAAWTGLGWIGTLVWAVWPKASAIADPLFHDATGSGR